MIKFEKTQIFGWEPAIRGMRNPMNSWEKSDSVFYKDGHLLETPIIGKNDLTLMKKLRKGGPEDRKYLRMIIVYADITAPLYWWSEYDTYKVGTVANSCSKMHKLLSKPFEISDFSVDKLFGYKNEIKQFSPEISEEMVAKEIWQHIDCNYDVSNYGRIKHKFDDHYRIISGSLHKDGYRFVTLYGKQYPLHRIVAYVFHNYKYKPNLEVNHIDGNKQNNFADNLEWVTRSENQKHAIENNLQPKSTNTYKGKFTEEERQQIKFLWDSGEKSKRQIAKEYNVSHTCINDIINDKYKYANNVNLFEEIAKPLVDTLNELRDCYFRTENEEVKKKIWYNILQLLPEGYNQRRTVMLNYEVLNNIFRPTSREYHKLDEWNVNCKGSFCCWTKALPYSKELIIGDTED